MRSCRKLRSRESFGARRWYLVRNLARDRTEGHVSARAGVSERDAARRAGAASKSAQGLGACSL
eukprot:3180427-Rhodomonas_salina.1